MTASIVLRGETCGLPAPLPWKAGEPNVRHVSIGELRLAVNQIEGGITIEAASVQESWAGWSSWWRAFVIDTLVPLLLRPPVHSVVVHVNGDTCSGGVLRALPALEATPLEYWTPALHFPGGAGFVDVWVSLAVRAGADPATLRRLLRTEFDFDDLTLCRMGTAETERGVLERFQDFDEPIDICRSSGVDAVVIWKSGLRVDVVGTIAAHVLAMLDVHASA